MARDARRRRRVIGAPGAWTLALACALGAAGASARDLDLTLYRDGETNLTPTLLFQTAYFAQTGAWGGASREILGGQVDDWAEWSIEPGIQGAFDFGRGGLVYGRLSGVGSWTRVGLDAAGSNFPDLRPGAFLLEDAYLGWRSGDLLPSLGKDAIDLSFGAQDYQVGTAFLWWDGGSDGGKRGAFWIGPNTAFAMTGIARLATGAFSGEAVWLTPNDEPDSHTRIVGINGDYAIGKAASLGGGYWYLYHSDDERRDGLHVIALRGSVAPIPAWPELVFSGEVAHEKNGRLNDSWGGYLQAGYNFLTSPWKPYLHYRFSIFSGDDLGQHENEAFDPLDYGSGARGIWNQGELIGQYVTVNQNLAVHMLRAAIQPFAALTLNLFFYHYRVEDQAAQLLSPVTAHAGNLESRSFGNEVDLTLDWAANSHVTFSAALAAFEPARGAEDFFGGDKTWLGIVLSATLRF